MRGCTFFMAKKEYRRKAILKWKKNSGRLEKIVEKLDMVACTLGFKKRYRKEAIIKWKRKRLKSIGNRQFSSTKTVVRTLLPPPMNMTKGKHLLRQVISSADILPDVLCCSYCGAMKFYSETSNFCCLEGRIVLSTNELPSMMHNLLTSTSDLSKSFRTYIRTYNNHFAFTSFGVRADNDLSKRNMGIYTFRVQGQVYHFLNDLQLDEKSAKNLQLYFHDTENEIENRFISSPRLSKELIAICMAYLQQNPYARFFSNLRDVPCFAEYKIILKTIPGQDQQVYNKPDVSQVAALWVEGEDNGEQGQRNIEVKTHSDQSRTVQYYYGCYDPLQYPLMFPFGELGWHQHIPKKTTSQRMKRGKVISEAETLISPWAATNVDELLDMEESVLGRSLETSKCVSIREYYAYKLQIRRNDKSCSLLFGRLLQQYIVDNYVKLETQRLAFYRTQQQELRQEFLQGVVDAMASGETNASSIGKRVILPANFIGGPRNMRRRYIDAMALVQKFGKPDIFLTLTCNPNWLEIKQHLMPHEETQNRADLIVRVFHAKLQQFKDEIFKKEIFGKVVAYTYVVEFQKRGLPHAHFLLILAPHYKMHHTEEYDEIVCDEIPDKNANPHLFRMVVKHMFHGPCCSLNPDNVCMKKMGTCKNFYPKDFSSQTTQGDDAYPSYRRRGNGVKVMVRGAELDNRWIVPYNPYLLYRYPHLKEHGGFSMGEIKPAVIHLPLHLENFQPITFKKRERLKNIVENADKRKTMLTEFFVKNRTDRFEQSLNLTYVQFPDHFVWKSNKKVWIPRQQDNSIGRIVVAHPSEGERYYLRMLLLKIRCPKSYEDLKVFNGVQVATFRESALVHGYLIDDNSQQLCLQEASVFNMPYELRRLFATLLVYTTPNNPLQLWVSFEDSMLEDLIQCDQYTRKEATRCAFQQVNAFLQSIGRQLNEFDVLPPDFSYDDLEDERREIRAEKSIVVCEADLQAIHNLNEKQKVAFDKIIGAVDCKKSGAFFVDGPGGTGKTFLYRALLAKIRSEGQIALATATLGIAASLLPGGRTAHSRFKIPLDLSDGMHCRISKQCSLANLIKSSKLIIWDEAPMAKRSAIEALDGLLQDLMDSSEIFGGKVVVLGGDFRQTLPVVRKGSKSETIAACLTNSFLWPSLCILQLEQNMRALLDPKFTEFLLRLGDGEESSEHDDVVTIPTAMIIESNNQKDALNLLIEYVYPSIFGKSSSVPSSFNRAILTMKNAFVSEINDVLIQKFPGEEIEYNSFDETLDVNDQGHYEDLLHSLTPNGMPPHRLVLKKNAPIILLRNMNPTEGLCNGIRLFCKDFNRNVIRAEIAFGDFAGKEVFIHRIPLQPPTGKEYTVSFKRIQFPIRLCFAMTINKAQGQTLDFVGVYLKEPVFSHGQLYVALSRAKRIENVKVLINHPLYSSDTNKTKNIVYQEVLQYAKHVHMYVSVN
uniref:ATP-dependent DNA helicase n=1 Tax=Lactuca sativa TaxID=4236 RepID=A0A9R1VSM7_LACSA|nr:hypothetical protein LSAT_V11C400209270 [Lactuca sativa]